MQARNKYPDEEFDPGQLDLALAQLDDAPYANDAPETLDDNALAELGLDQLDQVSGGWSGGGYVSAGFNVGGVGLTATLTFGSDGVHIYGSTQAGVGDEAQLSVSAGGWVSNTNSGADYWTQGSSNGSFGLKEGADVSVEGGWNTSGVSGGIQLGLAASPTVFGGNAGVSYGVQLDGAVNGAVDAVTGHGNDNPANDTSPGSLADQAGINDIGSHGADNHDGTTDHPTDSNGDHTQTFDDGSTLTTHGDGSTTATDAPHDGTTDHTNDGQDHTQTFDDGSTLTTHGDGTTTATDATDHTNDGGGSYNGNDYGDHTNDGGGGGTQVADAGSGGGSYDGGGGGGDGGGSDFA